MWTSWKLLLRFCAQILQFTKSMRISRILRWSALFLHLVVFRTRRPAVKLLTPGLQDTEASRQALDAWREQTKANFTLRMLPGEHFFIVTAQALFLRTLSRELYQIARKATQVSLGASPSLVVTSPVQLAGSK